MGVPVSGFYDDFADNTRDATKWSAYPSNITETGGQLKVAVNANGAAISAASNWDLLNSELVFDTALAWGGNIGFNRVEFGIYFSNFNSIFGFQRTGYNIAYRTPSGTGGSAEYNPANHRYLRVRGTSGNPNNTVYWERSGDGTTWTNMGTLTYQAGTYPLTNGTIFVRVDNYQYNPLGTHLAFNAVGTPPPPVPTGPLAWVWDGTTKQPATIKGVWDGSTVLPATPRIHV